eukprot:GHVU01219635.1.p1 GENE.GHVU01219635.1~~GHVU01219635.1.p1  ORF type:complete len:137 (+),score=4.64 GHVU01219635.1:1024-1434(+)
MSECVNACLSLVVVFSWLVSRFSLLFVAFEIFNTSTTKSSSIHPSSPDSGTRKPIYPLSRLSLLLLLLLCWSDHAGSVSRFCPCPVVSVAPGGSRLGRLKEDRDRESAWGVGAPPAGWGETEDEVGREGGGTLSTR